MGTLWFNGTFFTMREEGESIEAVYVESGKIRATGKKKDLEQQFSKTITRRHDLKGAYVYPGFVDSHLHLIGHGEKLVRLDLSEVESAEEMRHCLEQKRSETEKGEWLFGEGWNENNFVDRKIFHRQELDTIAPDRPMFLTRVCRHAALVNSEALRLAGISSETEDPVGGVIVRDNDGEPTGYLLDAATELVKSVIPNVTEGYLQRALEMAVDDLFRVGLVGGHTEDLHYYGGFIQTLTQFLRVIEGGKRKFRAHLLVHHGAIAEMEEQGFDRGEVTPFIELGAVKIFADGALGGRTALLSSPYTDDPSTSGVAMHSADDLHSIVRAARKQNRPVAIHTIGDGALDMALTALEQFPLQTGRDRLIHVQVVDESLLNRMQKLPLVLDIQPRFVAADFPWVMERLGQERLPYSFAWKTLLKKGLHCAGGSDAPIEPVDPLLGIHAAVTRKKIGENHGGYVPNEKLTAFEAVKLFTEGSAYAIEKENDRGKIEKGYVADFTILNQNLFTIDADAIPDTKVIMTVVDDTVMYEWEDEEGRVKKDLDPS